MSAPQFGKLPLDDSPRVKTFRAVEQIVRTDPTLRNVVKPESIIAYRGRPEDKLEFTNVTAPAIRMWFQPLDEPFWWPGFTKGYIQIYFNLLVDGLCVDDLDNLWWAIQRAVYPSGDPTKVLKLNEKLTAAGATTGLPGFQRPTYSPIAEDGTNGLFAAQTSILYEVTDSFR